MYTPKSQTAYFMDDRELEAIILEHFGVEWEIVPMMELNNESYKVYEVDNKPDKLAEQDVEDWLSGDNDSNGMYILYSILHDLVEHDALPPGKYVIDCSW